MITYKWMIRTVIDGKRQRLFFRTKRHANEYRAEYGIKAAVRRADY